VYVGSPCAWSAKLQKEKGMANDSGPLTNIIERIATGMGCKSVEPPRLAHSSWREEVIIVYCVGKGKFSDDTKFINLQMDMYDLQGNWLGFQMGVHQSLSTPQDLLEVPPPPTGPMNQPVGPVPHPEIKEWTKGVWTFADGSQIYAVGQARSHLVPFSDGSFLFMVATGQTITNGTGRYDGAHGTKQATGTTLIPAGLVQQGKFPAPGMVFDAKTVETFRILKRQDITELTPPPATTPPGSAWPDPPKP
jgi:hypothetical protein